MEAQLKPQGNHRRLIDESIDTCHKTMEALEGVLKKYYAKDALNRMINFLRSNTYFAGSMFRGIFTETHHNYVDLYFNSQDAVLEFEHLLHTDYTEFKLQFYASQEGYYLPRFKHKPIRFNTGLYGDPNKVYEGLVFSFNRHFYNPHTGEMGFDFDTFEKNGTTLKPVRNNPITNYLNWTKYQSQGFQIPHDDVNSLLKKFVTAVGGKTDLYQRLLDEGTYNPQTKPFVSNRVYDLNESHSESAEAIDTAVVRNNVSISRDETQRILDQLNPDMTPAPNAQSAAEQFLARYTHQTVAIGSSIGLDGERQEVRRMGQAPIRQEGGSITLGSNSEEENYPEPNWVQDDYAEDEITLDDNI